TPTPTPTITASPSGDRHYQCYEVHQGPANPVTVSANDLFGNSDIAVRRAKRICNPASKNDEDPAAIQAIHHLKAYHINQTTRFVPVKGLNVTNQFGSATLNLARPDSLLVPSSKSTSQNPAPPIQPTINHYKCYTIARAKARFDGIGIDDQFGH